MHSGWVGLEWDSVKERWVDRFLLVWEEEAKSTLESCSQEKRWNTQSQATFCFRGGFSGYLHCSSTSFFAFWVIVVWFGWIFSVYLIFVDFLGWMWIYCYGFISGSFWFLLESNLSLCFVLLCIIYESHFCSYLSLWFLSHLARKLTDTSWGEASFDGLVLCVFTLFLWLLSSCCFPLVLVPFHGVDQVAYHHAFLLSTMGGSSMDVGTGYYLTYMNNDLGSHLVARHAALVEI